MGMEFTVHVLPLKNIALDSVSAALYFIRTIPRAGTDPATPSCISTSYSAATTSPRRHGRHCASCVLRKAGTCSAALEGRDQVLELAFVDHFREKVVDRFGIEGSEILWRRYPFRLQGVRIKRETFSLQ